MTAVKRCLQFTLIFFSVLGQIVSAAQSSSIAPTTTESPAADLFLILFLTIGLGVFIAVAIAAIVCFFCLRRRHKKKSDCKQAITAVNEANEEGEKKIAEATAISPLSVKNSAAANETDVASPCDEPQVPQLPSPIATRRRGVHLRLATSIPEELRIIDGDQLLPISGQLTNYQRNGLFREMLQLSCTRTRSSLLSEEQQKKAAEEVDQRLQIVGLKMYPLNEDVIDGGQLQRPDIQSAVKALVSDGVAILLLRLILNGPRMFRFRMSEVLLVLDRCRAVLASESSLVLVPLPCTVYGDLLGQYIDLHRWFQVNGWPNQAVSVFLGSFVDGSASHSLELMVLLAALKVVMPERVFLVRGSHEHERCNDLYGFKAEIARRFPGQTMQEGSRDCNIIYTHFLDMFEQMPLAALIADRVLAVHGGIGEHCRSLGSIVVVQRPLQMTAKAGASVAHELLWANPDDGSVNCAAGVDEQADIAPPLRFSEQMAMEFCRENGVELIIRSNQCPGAQGIASFADGRVLTVFSAPGFDEQLINDGASVHIDERWDVIVSRLRPSSLYRQCRIAAAAQVNTTIAVTSSRSPSSSGKRPMSREDGSGEVSTASVEMDSAHCLPLTRRKRRQSISYFAPPKPPPTSPPMKKFAKSNRF